MKLDCQLETRKSSKGNDYTCAVIKISNNIEKVVFLEKAEIELLKLLHPEQFK